MAEIQEYEFPAVTERDFCLNLRFLKGKVLLQTVWEDLLPLLLTLLFGNVLIALVAMLSVLCWRKFRNLSFGEQFLDYKVIPTWTENADQSTEKPPLETFDDVTNSKQKAKKKELVKLFPSQAPPPWTPKPEMSVVSVQPQDQDRDDGDFPASSSSDEENVVSTSKTTVAAPYDVTEAVPVETFVHPSEADFLGRIYFSLNYNTSRKMLIVKLIKGEELPPYMAQSPNVMVEIKLTPSMKKDCLKSDIHEMASNPTFNEQFEFGLTFEEARKQSLLLFLVYMDKFSHPFCVGEIAHPLDHLNMEKINSSKEEMIVCREIQKRQTEKGRPRDLGFGQLLFSLMYMPLTRRLTIVVFKAKDLRAATEGYPAVYVEVVMINTARRLRKRKPTTLKAGTLSPVYNEAMAFDVANMELTDIKLQLFVKQKMEGEADKVMGRVILGSNAAELELQHWNEAMISKKPLAYWHSLKGFYPAFAAKGVSQRQFLSMSPQSRIARFFSTSSDNDD